MANTGSLRHRLLRDIAEIQMKPYPNIALRLHDDQLTFACLILTVEGYGDMHLTVEFPGDYPLNPPRIRMDSRVMHPNVFSSYICSSILNTEEGYTSAYTLKGITIQLLSFFSSDRVEQEGGGYSVDLASYRTMQTHVHDSYSCPTCQFGTRSFSIELFNAGERFNVASATSFAAAPILPPLSQDANVWPTPRESSQTTSLSSSASLGSGSSSGSIPPGRGQILGRNARRRKAKQNAEARAKAAALAPPTPDLTEESEDSPVEMEFDQSAASKELLSPRNIVDMKFPNEVVLLICDKLDTEELMIFAQAWAKIPRVMAQFDILRTRELQCFCLKETYLNVKLGVGIHVDPRTRAFESEFDLLSDKGFRVHRIRRSTQGRTFEHWLPLPISNGHWRKVSGDVPDAITKLATSSNIQDHTPAKVLYQFMNDIVVKLNQQATVRQESSRLHRNLYGDDQPVQSSLTHASEKAIESYFHLFHLLVCLATSSPNIVTAANTMIQAFISGRTSKIDCPNLGHLLVAALISGVDITESVIKAIIKEAVTRNVIWMLKSNPELAYLEPSPVSEYRLHYTFQASKTSYRLLMFLNLFRKTAVGNHRKPLIQLRDEAFERHGAPPRGSAKGLANAIKKIRAVDRFPDFLTIMDIQTMPSKAQFNTYLHRCMQESSDKGYSRMPITQGEALTLRQAKEPNVEVAEGVFADYMDTRIMSGRSFFPDNRGRGGDRGRGRGCGRGG